MRKNFLKLISFLLCFSIIFSFNFVLAEEYDFLEDEMKTDSAGEEHEDEIRVIKNVSNNILNFFVYFAYAIALGSLIFLGAKYLMSPANEKANLKELFPKYLIGIVAILSCFTIAKFVADIAGNDPAEEILEVGEEAGNHFGDKSNNMNGKVDADLIIDLIK